MWQHYLCVCVIRFVNEWKKTVQYSLVIDLYVDLMCEDWLVVFQVATSQRLHIPVMTVVFINTSV